MTTYNTGNPIGSTDPRDLYDNAENLDELVNSDSKQSHPDRLGVSRKTWHGMEEDFDGDQTRREYEFQGDQSSREAVFSDFLQASGYQDLGEYAPGIEITAHNQYVTFGGQPYLLKPSIPVPYTTSGEWTGDDFKLIGDDSLRQDLANPDKGAAMVARGVVAVDSIADLLALPEGQRREGLRYLVKGYYAGSDVGGGGFYWDTNKSKSEADAGTIIDPDNSGDFDGNPTSLSSFLNAQGNGEGTGCWVRLLDGEVSPEMFGAVGDGEVDDYRSIQAAANNSKGLPVKSKIKATYKLKGTAPLVFNNGADFTGSILDVEDYPTYINLGTSNTWSYYDSQSVPVTALRNGPDLLSPRWEGLSGIEEVDESFVILYTSEPYYTYRGDVVNRKEYNVVTRYGQVLSDLKTTLKASDIQEVSVLKINKHVTEYRGFTLRVGANYSSNGFIRAINATRIKVIDMSFVMDSSVVFPDTNPTFFGVINSCHVLVDGLHFSYPSRSTTNSGYTYNISLANSYDVKVCNAIAQGDGWGSTGSNNCQRVVFENCDLNRIDFHNPVMEYLKIRDCSIGSWGVLVTTIGDLIIENTTFKITQNEHINNRGFIRSRSDTGGFCQGNLRITGCKFYNYSETNLIDLIRLQSDVSTNPKPVGSSLDYNFWENIIIRDSEFLAPDENYEFVLGTGYQSSTVIKSYKNMVVENCRCNARLIHRDSNRLLPPTPLSNSVVEKPNKSLYYSNSDLLLLNMLGGAEYFMDITVENTHSPIRPEGVVAEVLGRCNLKINNSTVNSVRFFSGGTTTSERNVFISNSVLVLLEGSSYSNNLFDGLNTSSEYIDVLISNSQIIMDPVKATSSDGLLAATMSNCTVNGSNMVLWTGNTSINSPALIADNTYTVVTGTSLDGNLRHTDVKLPVRGSSKTYVLYVEEGSETIIHTIKLSMSGTGQLTVQAPEYEGIYLNTFG